MKQADSDHLDAVFGALAHPVRRQLLAQIAEGPQMVTALASQYDCSLNAISKHVKRLEEAQLIRRNKDGVAHHISLDAAPMQEALRWLQFYAPFWDQNLASLKRRLEGDA